MPPIRFYAGAPLLYTTKEGQTWRLGTLCVIDQVPRTLRDDEIFLLETLARLVVTELELRMTFKQREVKIEQKADLHAKTRAKEMNTAYIGQVAHDLRTPLNSFSLGLQALSAMPLDEEQKSIIDTMQVSAELMEITCTKAVDHSKFEAGQDFAAMKAPFDLLSVLRKSQMVVSGYTHESKNVFHEFAIDSGNHILKTISLVASSCRACAAPLSSFLPPRAARPPRMPVRSISPFPPLLACCSFRSLSLPGLWPLVLRLCRFAEICCFPHPFLVWRPFLWFAPIILVTRSICSDVCMCTILCVIFRLCALLFCIILLLCAPL